MIPRTILPNVVMDNLGLDVVMQMTGWELVLIMISFFLIGAGLVMLSDWSVNGLNLRTLQERFAIMSREYTNTIAKLKEKNK